jgi:hypothetical protein
MNLIGILACIFVIANKPIFHCNKLIHFYNLIKLELQKSDAKAG